ERLLRLLLQPDPAAVIYRTADADGIDRLVCRLIDPTPVLERGFRLAHASLIMSGTLAAPSDDSNELRYQVPLFGLPPTTMTRKHATPFRARNQQWIYCPDTYGVLRERQSHLSRYVEHIISIGNATPGVTAVFFSSYAFLRQVYDAITDTGD